jgi:methionyl-tRNA formyltransferase
MRVVILTGVRRGLASLALPALLAAGHDLAGVIYCERRPTGVITRLRNRVRKIGQIGVLGAANGIRMRSWFSSELADRLNLRDLEQVAADQRVPFHVSPGTNSERTIALMEQARCELALSLGNGYISRRVFSIPALGMINIHHELLPEYPGAQSVLWQIHDGSSVSGYTIHQIREQIDKGEILYRESVPIAFEPTLHQTVVSTSARLFQKSVAGLVAVLNRYTELTRSAEVQPPSGRKYTTPTWREFRTMRRQHRRLFNAISSSTSKPQSTVTDAN